MKKILLIVLVGLILFLLGCPEIGVKDCGIDIGCFQESLKNGERAKVSYNGRTIIESAGHYPGNYYTTKDTVATILTCENDKELLENTCKVEYTNMWYEENWVEKTERNVKKLNCDTHRENWYKGDYLSINCIEQ